MQDLALVVGQRILGDDLDVALAGAVVDFEEAEAALGIAARTEPALQAHLSANRFDLPRLGHADFVHVFVLLKCRSFVSGTLLTLSVSPGELKQKNVAIPSLKRKRRSG